MFRDALTLTGEQTGFSERLIEKDYFCTLLLAEMARLGGPLVFKGGTCLTKVHADFYRLSEDMDFAIPMATDDPRSQRSRKVAPFKAALDDLPERLPFFRLVQPLTGANSSTQYVGTLAYTSLVSGGDETVKIEIGLREPLLCDVFNGQAKTALLNPVTRQPWLPPVSVLCMARTEAFAEKFRAALSRREAAARDFFDLDYAIRKLGLRVDDTELIRLVRQKLAVAGNEPVDVSDRRWADLRRRVTPQLQPVLRENDFAGFDVDRAFRIVSEMAVRVGRERS